MDGNPLARSESYKFSFVVGLRRLEQLDGESISTLDRQVAQLYFEEKEKEEGEEEQRWGCHY